MTYELYKKVAEADPVPGAPSSRGKAGQQAAIVTTETPGAAMGAAFSKE